MTIVRWLAMVVILSLPALSEAATYYVSKHGSANNNNQCTSPDGGACATIQGGAGKMSGGDTLYIQQGTYVETLDGGPWSNGSSGDYTTYAKYPNDPARSVIMRPTGAYSRVISFLNGEHHIEIIGLVIDGLVAIDNTIALKNDNGVVHDIRFEANEILGHPTRTNFTAVSLGGSSNVFLRNTIHRSSNYCVYITADNIIFDGNTVHDCGGYGIHGFGGTEGLSNNTIRNNTFRNCGFDGICADSRPCTAQALLMHDYGNNEIYNNIVYDSYEGIQIGGNQGSVYNNTVYNTGHCVFIRDNGVNIQVKNNICYQSGSGIVNEGSGTSCGTNLGPGCGSIGTGDPGFKSLAGGAQDFHILAGSPAIGAGPRQGSVLTDAEGRTRSDPTTLGAYEFVADNPPPEPPPPGLQAWFRGNGTADDSSGNARHGVLQGGALANGACITCPDTSFVFDGINDYISIVENVAFRPTDHFCISAWINSTNLNYAYIWDIQGYGLWHDPTGNLHGYISPSSGFVDVVTPSSNILTGVNNHLVYTKRPLGLYLYLNGNQAAFTPTTSTLTYIGTPSVFIGRNSAGAQEFFNGRKAAIRFYNAECTPAAVLNLFNEGVPLANTATTHMQAAKTNFAQSEANLVGALDADIWHLRTEPLDLIFTITRTGTTTNVHYPLECALNGGSFLPVTNVLGAHGVQITSNSALNMGDPTTVPLPANLPTSGMTPVPGIVVADTINTAFTVPLNGGEYTQVRYSVAFGAPAAVLDTIQCQPDGVDTPTNIKTITLLAPPSERRLDGGRFEGVSLR